MIGTPTRSSRRRRGRELRIHRIGSTVALIVATAVGLNGPGATALGTGSFEPARQVVGDWAWPVAPPHPVVRPYLAPATRYSAGHRGIDIAGAAGAPILAPSAGIVHFAGVVVDRPVLSIEHPSGELTSYEPVVTSLVAGTTVGRGDEVGRLQPGHCSRETCLHFGVRVDGDYVSPLLYLGGVPRAVLLPMDR